MSYKKLSTAILGLILIFTALYLLTPKPGYEEEVKELVANLKSEITRIRGLPEPRNVVIRIVDSKWVLENWGKPSISNLKKLRADEEVFKFLLLINENYNLSEFMLQWSGLTLAATVGNQLYVVRDLFDPGSPDAKRALVHELMHIVQSQEFSIPERKTMDGKYALNALIEGDADFTADKYVNESLSKHSTTIIGGSSADGSDASEQLIKLWSFPYEYGRKFISYLYTLGGWSLVNRAYLSPPNSTEQILHPEKYISNESFQMVEITFTNSSWTLEKTDRMGEYFIYIVASKWVNQSTSISAAEGWNGDKLNLYSDGKNYILIWKITWDSSKDAMEFYLTFNDICRSAGGRTISTGSNRVSWKVGERLLTIEIFSNQTVITGMEAHH